MKNPFLLLLYFLFTFSVSKLSAQEYPRKDLDMRVLQDFFSAQKTDVNYEEVTEALAQLYQKPLDLNTCSRDELAATFMLSEGQMNSFFEYRQTAGALLSVYELQAIPLFDLPTIYRLLPFVKVSQNSNLKGSLKTATQFVLFRANRTLEERKGFSEASKTRYEGSPLQYFFRYKLYAAKDISAGITIEKDPGEAWNFAPAQKRFGGDFTSLHLSIQNRGILKNLTVGDYQLQIGQGLLLSAGLYIGKGAETVLNTRRSHLGIRPYTSSIENNFLRGAAATVQLGKVEVTGFYSRQRRDANLLDANTFSSLQTSGLHRTAAEIADQQSITATDIGTDITYKTRRASMGITVLNTGFDKRFQKDLRRAYNLYDFAGAENALVSGHYGYLWQNFNFFGEIARSSSGGIGAVSGVVASLSKRWDATLLFRHYDRNFHSFYANSFAEGSRSINESGVYMGAKYVPNRKFQMGFYADFYQFPYLKYLVSKPSAGSDYLFRVNYSPSKTRQFSGLIHAEFKEKDIPARLTKADETNRTNKWNMMLGYQNKFSGVLSAESRLFLSRFNYRGYAPSQGWAFVQDVSADWGRLSLTGRVAYFQTNDYDSRIYVYENDVLYAFSFPAYYDTGIRTYLLAQYSLNKRAKIWLRASRTNLFDQDTIGSSLDEIPKPHRTDIRVQVKYDF